MDRNDDLPSYQDAVDGNLISEPISLDLDADGGAYLLSATDAVGNVPGGLLLMDNEEDELSEEVDNDLVEDSLPMSSSTAAGGAAVDGNRRAAVDGGTANDRSATTEATGDDEATHRAVLFEGDYFPSIPANVLAELEALDAEGDDDDDIDRAPSPVEATDAPMKRGRTEEDAVSGAVTSSPQALPPPSRDTLSSSEASPSVPSPRLAQRPSVSSSGDAQRAASPAIAHATAPASSSVFASGSRERAAEASDAVATEPPTRKRVRWADQTKGKSVLHHVPRFIIPGFGPSSSAARRSSVMSRHMTAKTSSDSAAAVGGGVVDHHGAVPVFRECTNDDRSVFLASRVQRPSRRFAQWKAAALHCRRRDGAALGPQTDDRGADGAMAVARQLPNAFQVAIERCLSQPQQQQPSPQRRCTTMYAALFPDLPSLLGNVALGEGDRFATKLVNVALAGTAPLDDAGMMAPPLWLFPAAVHATTPTGAPDGAAVPSGMGTTKSTPQDGGGDVACAIEGGDASSSVADSTLRLQYGRGLEQRRRLLCVDGGSLDGPIRIAL